MSLGLGQLVERCLKPLQLKHSTFLPLKNPLSFSLEDLSNLFLFPKFYFLLNLLLSFKACLICLAMWASLSLLIPLRFFFFILRNPKSCLFRLLRIWKGHFIGLKKANKFINSHGVGVLAFPYIIDLRPKPLRKWSQGFSNHFKVRDLFS